MLIFCKVCKICQFASVSIKNYLLTYLLTYWCASTFVIKKICLSIYIYMHCISMKMPELWQAVASTSMD